MMFETFSDEKLFTLYTIAKDKKKGARPFFKSVKLMIALRQEVQRRLTLLMKEV